MIGSHPIVVGISFHDAIHLIARKSDVAALGVRAINYQIFPWRVPVESRARVTFDAWIMPRNERP